MQRSAEPQERRVWDLVLTLVLTVLLVAAAFLLGFAGALLAMASDPCGGTTVCRIDQLSAGVFVAMLGPAVVSVVAVVAVVERLVRNRLAFWVPVAGGALAALVWAGGAALVFTSVPS